MAKIDKARSALYADEAAAEYLANGADFMMVTNTCLPPAFVATSVWTSTVKLRIA